MNGREDAMNELESLGFPRDQVASTLEAVNWDRAAAADMLLAGLDEGLGGIEGGWGDGAAEDLMTSLDDLAPRVGPPPEPHMSFICPLPPCMLF